MKILYTASATANGGRNGGVRSSDGILDLQLELPTGLGGPGGKSNPEQLFAAGYAACFHNAIKRMAAEHKVSIKDSTVTANVGIGRNDAGNFALEVELVTSLPNATPEEADKIVKAADRVCPYSNATRGNVNLRLTTTAGSNQPVTTPSS